MKFNHSHLLLTLLFLIVFSQISITHSCYDHERNSLLSFKSLLTDSSGRLSSWQGQNCCTWHGVRCSNSFNIVAVDLRNPNPHTTFTRGYYSKIVFTPSTCALNGTISPLLFNLIHLEYLDLSFNYFHFSAIPYEFHKLKNLHYVNLSNSMFSGSVTKQFANLSSLKYLDISCSYQINDYSSKRVSLKQKQTYLPTSYISSRDLNWLRGLSKLEVLVLTGVDLSVSSSSIWNWAESYLSNLKELYLSNCSISGPTRTHNLRNLPPLSILEMNSNFFHHPIPHQLANITSLTILRLKNCHLKGSLIHIPQLTELDVDGNGDLTVNLTEVFHHPWSKLKKIDLSSTKVIGILPESISNAPLLEYFRASHCSIRGPLLTSLTNLSQLWFVDLSSNNITSFLPSSISNLKNLTYLNLNQNNLQGPISNSICKISSLRLLDLGGNNLSETIPSCIEQLQYLSTFDVSGNSIRGIVPLTSWINRCNFSWVSLGMNKITTLEMNQPLFPWKTIYLETLYLQSCNLNGSIPKFICNLTNLIDLRLADNQLTGTIPSCLFNLPNLSILDLSRNNLGGPLPHSLHLNLNSRIRDLLLSSNKFVGSLPPKDFEILDLSQNQFSGEISNEIGEKLSSGAFVFLSGNKLSGNIPLSICSKKHNLVILDISNNTLSGTIPYSLHFCTSLVSLNLGINNLSGNIPYEFKRIKNLKSLQLNNNNLQGTFPSIIQYLQDLEFLDLQNNNFEGNLPTFIGSLHNLKILSLRSNKFNGSIPNEIVHLEKLQILVLSHNTFSGPIPRNVGSLKMLTSRPNTTTLLDVEVSVVNTILQVEMITKGVQQSMALHEYNSNIDLSFNNLNGTIPNEIGQLKGLPMLNLSHNSLSGEIPSSIGKMIGLDSLDLSFNRLSGEIPQSLTLIDSLGLFNISFNNLSGIIPRSPHFDTLSLDSSAYYGNPFLCGFPMNKTCKVDDSTIFEKGENEDEDGDEREKWLFYGVVVLGFGVGFWGLFLVLLLRKDKWWVMYWNLIDSVSLRMAKFVLRS